MCACARVCLCVHVSTHSPPLSASLSHAHARSLSLSHSLTLSHKHTPYEGGVAEPEQQQQQQQQQKRPFIFTMSVPIRIPAKCGEVWRHEPLPRPSKPACQRLGVNASNTMARYCKTSSLPPHPPHDISEREGGGERERARERESDSERESKREKRDRTRAHTHLYRVNKLSCDGRCLCLRTNVNTDTRVIVSTFGNVVTRAPPTIPCQMAEQLQAQQQQQPPHKILLETKCDKSCARHSDAKSVWNPLQ